MLTAVCADNSPDQTRRPAFTMCLASVPQAVNPLFSKSLLYTMVGGGLSPKRS